MKPVTAPYLAQPVLPTPSQSQPPPEGEDSQSALLARGLANAAARRADPAESRRRGLEAAARVLGRPVADVERYAVQATARGMSRRERGATADELPPCGARQSRDDLADELLQRGVRQSRRGFGWQSVVVDDNWESGSPVAGVDDASSTLTRGQSSVWVRHGRVRGGG